MYSSYTNGHHSYFLIDAQPDTVDSWSSVYNKPRVSHEMHWRTYVDLSLKNRYEGLKVGHTQMFSSIEKHLEEKGSLKMLRYILKIPPSGKDVCVNSALKK